MSPGRRAAILIAIGVAVLVLALLVMIRNRSLDDELLATIALLGGLAIVINSLPGNGSKNGAPHGP